MSTWILIIGLVASFMSENEFGALQSIEFNSKEKCEVALNKYNKNFGDVKGVNTKAICVEK